MAVAKKSQTTAVVSSGTGSTNVNLPSSPALAEDDFVEVFLCSDDTIVNSTNGVLTSGYTLAYNTGGNSPGGQFAHKFMGVTPDSVVNIGQINGRDISVIIRVYTGVDTSTPIDNSITANSDGNFPNPSSHTTVTDGALRQAAGFLDDDDVAANVTGISGWEDPLAADTGGGSSTAGATVMVDSLAAPTAGALDPAEFSHSSGFDASAAIHFALRPAAGGGAIEASGAQTLPALTQSATGAQDVSAAAAQTLPKLGQSASGAMDYSATAALFLPSLSQAASGTMDAQGLGVQAFPALTQAASGTQAGASVYQPNGVEFDGTNDWVSILELTGADAKADALFAVWFNTESSGDGVIAHADDEGEDRVLVGINNGTVYLQGRAGGGSLVISLTDDTGGWNDGAWHHIAFSRDGSAGTYHFLIDGGDVASEVSATTGDIDFGGSFTWGAKADGSVKFTGCMGQGYLAWEYLDLSVGSNVDKLVVAGAAGSVDYGSDGSTPTGTQPVIYLDNETPTWQNNLGSGGDFTENGALTDCATDPPAEITEFSADGASLLPALTQAASGAQRFVADAVQILPALTQQASGEQTEPTGDGAQILPGLTQAASGGQEFLSDGASTLPSLEQAGSGGMDYAGDGGSVLPFLRQLGLAEGVGIGQISHRFIAVSNLRVGL